MAYLFVLAMCAMALLFVFSKVTGDMLQWLVQKVIDLAEEIKESRTNNNGSAE